MESTKRAIKFQMQDFIKSLGTFWIIMLQVNIFTGILYLYTHSNVRIGVFMSDSDLLSMTASNIMPILIFFIVYGIVLYHEDFALGLSLGITRNDFYKSAILKNILVSFSFALIQTCLLMVEKFAVKFFDYKLMVEFGLFNTVNDNVLIIVLTLFVLFLLLISYSNLLGVLQFRLGYKLWIGIGIIALILTNISINTSIDFSLVFPWFNSKWSKDMSFILSLINIIILNFLGYFLLRKAELKK